MNKIKITNKKKSVRIYCGGINNKLCKIIISPIWKALIEWAIMSGR
jgi:hypothetical protein